MFAGMLAAHNSSGTWGKFDRTAWWWDSFECRVVSEIDNVRNVLITSLRKVRIFFAFASLAAAQQSVSFPTQDGAVIYADMYGNGDRAVVLAHGGRFQKDGWAPQARTLAASGFRVLAIDFRGEGKSHGGAEEDRRFDVLGAVHYLRKTGAKNVSVVGASMGGDYAAEAAEIEPAAIDRFVLLGSGAYTALTKMKGPKLFILARDDANDDGPRLPKIRAQYLKALDPKELIIVDGSAHAQFLFETDQGERVMHEILRFLTE
jgi:pimeloyl-ACP methyl ester carboxylesterase